MSVCKVAATKVSVLLTLALGIGFPKPATAWKRVHSSLAVRTRFPAVVDSASPTCGILQMLAQSSRHKRIGTRPVAQSWQCLSFRAARRARVATLDTPRVLRWSMCTSSHTVSLTILDCVSFKGKE